MRTIERVHIVPLGFERSIVTKPLKKLGGDRVHILAINSEKAESRDPEMLSIQQHFNSAVIEDLRRMGFDVRFTPVNLFNFEETVEEMSKIIASEKEKGSDVYVNASSSGRLVSVAASLTGWYHDCTVYYVEPDRYYRNDEEFYRYGRSVCINPKIYELPKIEVGKISDKERFVLYLLHSKNGQARTIEILRELASRFSDFEYNSKVRREQQRVLNKLNRLILDKLERKNYVKRVKIGRFNIIKLTSEGKIISLLESGSWNVQPS